MRDPHVKSLRYRLIPGPGLSFDNPEPVRHETEAFRIYLADGIVTLHMKLHHASERSARQQAESYLAAWVVVAGVRHHRIGIRFDFAHADLVDRAPARGGIDGHGFVAVGRLALKGEATHLVIDRRYPDPPNDFAVSPDVASMWHRYQRYRDNHEPLPSMAYFCLTVVRTSIHGRPNLPSGSPDERAGHLYGIEPSVLEMLGNLTNLGDERTARKRHANLRPLTHQEGYRIECVVEALILRLGEWAAAPTAPRRQITMADFPQLGSL
jgi:hypothetical protein